VECAWSRQRIEFDGLCVSGGPDAVAGEEVVVALGVEENEVDTG
jgi:hypothetical protein